MDKEKIREFCEQLIESYEVSEDQVNHDRGTSEDFDRTAREIEALRQELNELLK
ncbi:hypothetical protein NST58_06620 [Paenibacillus sp. FSL R10-2796]|uniref:hypothetical protein n=1 Tax=Paenibacillus sp. FSL R10-2796 TaxID=2954663 RepID=UPI0030D96231